MKEDSRNYESSTSIMGIIEDLANRVGVPDDDPVYEDFVAEILSVLETYGSNSAEDAIAFRTPQVGYVARP